MKVDRNQLMCSVFDHGTNPQHGVIGGIPLRLEIAARLMASQLVRTPPGVLTTDEAIEDLAGSSLGLADTLIEAYNATCGEVAGE